MFKHFRTKFLGKKSIFQVVAPKNEAFMPTIYLFNLRKVWVIKTNKNIKGLL